MTFRPLSSRDTKDVRFDEPQEGVPEYMKSRVFEWIFEQMDDDVLSHLELAFRLNPPLDWSSRGSAMDEFTDRLNESDVFILDVVDFLVSERAQVWRIDELEGLLEVAGSVWEAVRDDQGRRLQRRAIGPISDAMVEIGSVSARTETHLRASWSKIMGRNPDPTGAYREAVKAVEVAAKPVVSPNDPVPTLGKMIQALNDKPDKWETVIFGGVPSVSALARDLWKGQSDRHGNDDDDVPISVSMVEADAAFYMALTLSRLFLGPGFSVKPKPS